MDSAFENQPALACRIMDATPIRNDAGTVEVSAATALACAVPPRGAAGPGVSLAARWDALHEAAQTLARLVGGPAGAPDPAARDGGPGFAEAILAAGGWRQALAEQGIGDLAAIMEAGLVALLEVHARGVDPAPAAEALWQEFLAARQALLALLPPTVSQA